jgi:transcription factor WhiB
VGVRVPYLPRAACADADPALFSIESIDPGHLTDAAGDRVRDPAAQQAAQDRRQAGEAICAGCPEREACRAWAAAVGEWGLWGGELFYGRRASHHPPGVGRLVLADGRRGAREVRGVRTGTAGAGRFTARAPAVRLRVRLPVRPVRLPCGRGAWRAA